MYLSIKGGVGKRVLMILRSSANKVVCHYGTIMKALGKLLSETSYTVHKVAFANKDEISMQIASSLEDIVAYRKVDYRQLQSPRQARCS